jgi:hypothetical protein
MLNLQIFRRYVMKPFTLLSLLIVFFFLGTLSWADIPQLINYQGMLTDNAGNPLNEPRDLTFTIYDAPTSGTALWTETHTAVSIENGLFNVILGGATTPVPDYVFDQPERFLGIKVGTDSELTPRIQLTSVGYAYRARWAGRSDTADYALSSPSGPGDYIWAFRITDGGDTTITTGGDWGIARFDNVLYGNQDSTHVNLGVACTTGTSGHNYKYCTVGGGYRNTASGSDATVGGGYRNTASGSDATVGGGYHNTADTSYATVGGGSSNEATGRFATVGGGSHNTADTSYATVGGGMCNNASGYYSTVGGGVDDTASGKGATVAGGRENFASQSSATVGGGQNNTASGVQSTVAGGGDNTASNYDATVAGGWKNTASGYSATVGGGFNDTASGDYATVAGGWDNTADTTCATVGGGHHNTASGDCATVAGGYFNIASRYCATIAGGGENYASQSYATVGGGLFNGASNQYATVPGGYVNWASGSYSFAAGCRAKAYNDGAFVWADHTDSDFASTGSDQFLIRASGGVGIGTNSPEAMLHVQDAIEGVIKVGTPTANGKATIIFEEGDDDAMALRYNGSLNELRIDDETTANTRMVIERNGNVGIGTTTPATKLAVLGLTGTSSSSYNYVRVNTSTGAFYYYTSSERYKEDVRPLEDDFHKIFQAEPKSFIDKTSGQREIGYIAEEFDGMGLKNLVIYDKEGRPDGLKYELVSLYLLEAMKDQAEMMKELETDNEKLRRRIEALEAR